MAITRDLGIVTAYGYAKSKGYTGTEEEFALLMADYADVANIAEAWAVGTRAGVPVEEGDEAYHNNAKYYSGEAGEAAESAEGDADTAEAYAKGTVNGVPVEEGQPGYEDNAKFYAGEASDSAESAAGSEQAAKDYADHIADPVSGLVTGWLNDHVDPSTGYVIDNTLTVQNAAADAKKVGDELTDVKSAINYVKDGFAQTSYPTWAKHYATVSNGVINSSSSYTAVGFPVQGGKKIAYKTGANESQAGICFYDSTRTFISGELGTNTEQIITVPANAVYAIASYRTDQSASFSVYNYVSVTDIYGDTVHMDVLTDKLCEPKILQIVEGQYVRYDNGTTASNAAYNYYVFDVMGGDIVTYKNGIKDTYGGIAFYDASGTYISGYLMTLGEIVITVPQNAVTAKATVRLSWISEFSIKQGRSIFDIEHKFEKDPYFVLPSRDIAVVGHEWNLYFDNVINGYDPEEYSVTVTISPSVSSAKTFTRYLRMTPVAGDVGTKTITLTLYRKRNYEPIESKTISLVVINDATLSGKKVMFLGDSLTAAGIYPAEIQYNLSNGGIVSVGTISKTCEINNVEYTVNIEGRSGWSASDYNSNKTGNPFWDGSAFNFGYYMSQNNIDVPDIVCVGLGTNGAVNSLDDVAVIVNSIHSYDADIMVIVSAIAPPASQNGVGYLNKLQSANNLKNMFLTVDAEYIDSYEGKTNSDIATLYFNLDREYDFNTVTMPVSSRNPTTVTIQANNVHPSEYGYLKFADSYYNRLLYYLS